MLLFVQPRTRLVYHNNLYRQSPLEIVHLCKGKETSFLQDTRLGTKGLILEFEVSLLMQKGKEPCSFHPEILHMQDRDNVPPSELIFLLLGHDFHSELPSCYWICTVPHQGLWIVVWIRLMK